MKGPEKLDVKRPRRPRRWRCWWAVLAVVLWASVVVAVSAGHPAGAQQDPKEIGGLELSSDAPGVLTVSWEAPESAPVDYRLIWAKSDESFRSYGESDGNAYPTTNSHTLSGLEGGVTYKVRVRARYGTQAPGPWSERAEAFVAADLGDITDQADPVFAVHSLDGTADDEHLFGFELSGSKRVGIGLRQLDHNADLALEDTYGNELRHSANPDDDPEWIGVDLPEGSYRIRVSAAEAGANTYILRYGVTDADPNNIIELPDPPQEDQNDLERDVESDRRSTLRGSDNPDKSNIGTRTDMMEEPTCPTDDGSEVTISDTALRGLIERRLGLSAGATITTTQMRTLTWLSAESAGVTGIADASALKHAANLGSLNLLGNELTSLDLTCNTKLTFVNANENEITSITGLDQLTELKWLNLSDNELTAIDVSANTKLLSLHLSGNNLTALDVSSLTAMSGWLWICENSLTAIDVTGLDQLSLLNVNGNPQLRSIVGLRSSTSLHADWSVCRPTSERPGKSQKIGLSVDFKRADLRSLEIDGVNIGTFDVDVTHYTAIAGSEQSTVTVNAVAEYNFAEVDISPDDADGDSTNGHQVTLDDDMTEITIAVANGIRIRNYRTYKVVITKSSLATVSDDTSLKSLTLTDPDDQEFDIGFSSDDRRYEVAGDDLPMSLTVAYESTDGGAEVTVTPADADTADGHQVDLSSGLTTIVLDITSSDGKARGRYEVALRAIGHDDTTLSSLTLTDPDDNEIDIGFSPSRRRYGKRIDESGPSSLTIDYTPTGTGAKVEVTPADADTADGHQVDLSSGLNSIELDITARDGTTTGRYVVEILRGPAAEGGRQPELDLQLTGSGLWSDRTTVWVVAVGHDSVRAYDLATGERRADRDISDLPGSSGVDSLWSDGTVLWMSASAGSGRFYAYDLATGAHLSDRDFTGTSPSNWDSSYYSRMSDRWPYGIWSDGNTMWRSRIASPGHLFAYDMDTGVRQRSKEIGGLPSYPGAPSYYTGKLVVLREADNKTPTGIWSDGDTIWVADRQDKKIYAYELSTGNRRAYLEIDALDSAGNDNPYGIWSNGETMWVGDYDDARFYAYRMPATARLNLLELSDVDFGFFVIGHRDYEASVDNSVTTTTVSTSAPDGVAVTVSGTDADTNTEGFQVSLAEGENVITVTATHGTMTATYTVTVTRGS